ncbi:MAG: hypothetical protein JXM70_07570 [Pirellulales bacterium]|nr:hypothetical protein [Pirellulales bacterium]
MNVLYDRMPSRPVATILTFVLLFVPLAATGRATDFSEQYPVTLDCSKQPKGFECTSDQKDVWRLTEFSYSLGDKFRITISPSQVVFGCHGTNVLWAAIFPDKPGEIVAADSGQGEHVTSVWMRFHPARVGELFPAKTVSGQGEASMLAQSQRLAGHKMRSCWQSGNRPMVPWKKSIVIDVETSEGPRRFYDIDTEAGTVRYIDAFRKQTLPRPTHIDRTTALEAFDTVWKAFDRQYAMFAIKPKVDWGELRDKYRARAETVENNRQLGAVLAEMLTHLEDLHVYVKVGEEYMPGYNRHRPLNGNVKAIPHLVGPLTETHKDLAWTRTKDGIGYVNIYRLSNQRLPQTFDEVLQQMSDTKGLIIDLRFNGGGSESLGVQIAGRFLDRQRVYSLSRYRNGPKHTDLGPKHERAYAPSGPWHYTGPVIVLIGQRTMSSAESFALMLAQCPQVTTMGDRTAGSSGNPSQVRVAGDILVNLPRWIDMDPAGKPIDAVGVPPDVMIQTTEDDFADEKDPVLEAALKNLRQHPSRKEKDGVLQRRGLMNPQTTTDPGNDGG